MEIREGGGNMAIRRRFVKGGGNMAQGGAKVVKCKY